MDKELRKAQRAYDKAWCNLRTERDRVFPVGTKVKFKKWVIAHSGEYTVTGDSLYADQIHLNGNQHAGFNSVEKVENDNE